MSKLNLKSRKKVVGAEKDYIKTVERLITILSRLDKGGSLSTAELAEKLGVTQRTIQRDLDLLCRSGYPITEKERGRYIFMEGFSLKKIELSEEQASLLSFMFDISHSLGEKFEDSFRGLFKRVMTRNMETPFYAKLPAGIKLPCDERIVKDLEDAIYDCERVRMSYQPDGKDAKDYLLEPFKIALYDGFWYLIANDVVRKKLLKLRLERIRKVDHTSEAFVPPANLMTLLDQSVNVWFEEKRGERVLIKVAAEAAKYFKQKTFFPLQKIVKEEKDGSLLLETFPGHPEEISHVIMNWIPCLTVLEPVSFKDGIKRTVAGYLKGL
jgi:predicted DNA-binding transcriptional regulator YafY